MSGRERGELDVGGVRVPVSHLDRVLWPGEGLTKRDLIAYYVGVAPYLLPHLARRPLSFTRWPEGITGEGFFAKDCPPGAPAWVRTWPWWSKDSGRTIDFVLADDAATLAWAANLGCVEAHPWLSTIDHPERPDRAVFDLDPAPPAGFAEVVEIALVLRDMLRELGLRAYPKTSGATGLHIYVPIVPRYRFREVAAFVGRVADALHRALPERTTRERAVRRRRGVYIDHLQNGLGKTIAAAYSVRPRPGAPVSTPMTWEELPAVAPELFTIRTAPARFQAVGDLLRPLLGEAQPLDDAVAAIDRLLA